MFQTELIKFLQSFEMDWLTDFMVFVSKLGYPSFYIPIVILITFGVNFRKGFLLIQMMLWCGILTLFLKNVFTLPRPAYIDSNVKLLEGVPNSTLFADMGSTGFWRLPDPEAIRFYRAQPDVSFGLPSGHVSGTTTFWGGLSLLFRYTVVRATAVVIIVLMPVSRMYLGQHFLADVLAGFLLAAIVLAISYYFFTEDVAHGRFFKIIRRHLAMNCPNILILTFSLLIPVSLLMLSPMIEPVYVGRLFGLNAAFVLLSLRELPNDKGTLFKRAGRVLVAFVLYLSVGWLIGLGIEISTLNKECLWTEFFAATISTFVLLWGGVKVSLGIGLYTKNAGVQSAFT